MRRLVGVAAALLAHGCGTSILLSYPTNVPFLRGHSDAVIAKRPLEDSTQTTTARIETGPLRVSCQTTTLTPKIEATMLDSFDGIGRVWCGFMAVSEGAIAAGIALDGKTDGAIIAGSIIGADALGALIYAIVAHTYAGTHTEVGPGSPETSQSCGDDLAVHADDQSWPIKRDGSIDGDVKALASAAVAGHAIAIAGGGLEAAWAPDARDRCALVAQFAIDDPSGSCTRAAEVTVAPVTEPPAPPPFELKIRLHVRPPAK
jgi:hypothetical protein